MPGNLSAYILHKIYAWILNFMWPDDQQSLRAALIVLFVPWSNNPWNVVSFGNFLPLIKMYPRRPMLFGVPGI